MNIKKVFEGNSYPGRGIILGQSAGGGHAALAYFIMGRSVNSRNRVFLMQNGALVIRAYDTAKLLDASLIIYTPLRELKGSVIISNGDQTDTIFDVMSKGGSFEGALATRCFEPDAPNYTPRVSGLMSFNGKYSYKLSILKAGDSDGKTCSRQYFAYEPREGEGHLIHTYKRDGKPLPSFDGEPTPVEIPSDFNEFSESVWDALDGDNKVAMYARFTDLKTGKISERLFNIHNTEGLA